MGGGREAGFEYELIDLVIGQNGIDSDAACFRSVQNPCPVQSGAVVFDLDRNVDGLMPGAQGNRARRRLAYDQKVLDTADIC